VWEIMACSWLNLLGIVAASERRWRPCSGSESVPLCCCITLSSLFLLLSQLGKLAVSASNTSSSSQPEGAAANQTSASSAGKQGRGNDAGVDGCEEESPVTLFRFARALQVRFSPLPLPHLAPPIHLHLPFATYRASCHACPPPSVLKNSSRGY